MIKIKYGSSSQESGSCVGYLPSLKGHGPAGPAHPPPPPHRLPSTQPSALSMGAGSVPGRQSWWWSHGSPSVGDVSLPSVESLPPCFSGNKKSCHQRPRPAEQRDPTRGVGVRAFTPPRPQCGLHKAPPLSASVFSFLKWVQQQYRPNSSFGVT